MNPLRRFLILLHRYLGIPLSVLFVLWFVTGIAMIYVGGMPQLSPRERLERLAPLPLDRVALLPPAAAERAGVSAEQRVRLVAVMDRPAYRFGAAPYTTTVFADDGELLDEIDVDRARTVAGRFLEVPSDALRYFGTIESADQWTLQLGRELPLYKFVDDDAGTEVYVSPVNAEVVLATTARDRALAWIATIPHWFYFTPLRANQPLWYWTVVGAAALGCLLAAAGLVLGVLQFRRTKPFRLAASIRYVGWMRWHYVLGALFGVFALTWVFSGLLSMEPFSWSNARGLEVPRDALSGGSLELERFASLGDAARWRDVLGERVPKEIELKRIHDRPYYVARHTSAHADGKRERLHQPYQIGGRNAPESLLVDAETFVPRREPFGEQALLERLRAAEVGAAITDSEWLTDYDAYYYSRGRQAPLPVLRVKFADPLETWVYIDAETSEVVAAIHRLNRLERWLYNGLHSLDFGFWYDRRPLWDIGMIGLSLGALGASVIGFWMGLKRLRLRKT
jgi:PepSY-associated TM region